MSNIYIQEPPTSGKVLLETSVGDIDIELWAKETPKACRNFIQLCLEGYYNGTIFHRVIKGFIVQGGDPKGDGTGGESIYGKPFQDELHSRLRFNRRGLVAMCNGGVPHDNGSQFFFTLAACPHLQGKHTIFGKVMGETLFNMLKLEDALVDHDDRPHYPHKIIKAVVLNNPFSDIVPRMLPGTTKSPKDGEERDTGRKKKDKKSRSGVKDFKLLSFGEEAEEDEEEVAEANKQFANKGKSTHDLLSDPKLSSEPAVEETMLQGGMDSEEENSRDSQDTDWKSLDDKDGLRLERVRNKLSEAKKKNDDAFNDNQSDEEEEYTLGQDRKRESSKKAEEIREEIRKLKREMVKQRRVRDGEKELAEVNAQQCSKIKEESAPSRENELVQSYMKELETFAAKQEKIPPKGEKREAHTLSMLKKFHKRLKMVKEKAMEEEESEAKEEEVSSEKKPEIAEEDLDGRASDSWLIHKLQNEDDDPVLAKDANKTKGDDWFEIYDPRNPINQRRREASRQAMQQKKNAGLSKHSQLR